MTYIYDYMNIDPDGSWIRISNANDPPCHGLQGNLSVIVAVRLCEGMTHHGHVQPRDGELGMEHDGTGLTR